MNCTGNGHNFVTKDRESDGSSTHSVAFLFRFYGCKVLNLLYLFASLVSVSLKGIVSVTEETRHSIGPLSHAWDLDSHQLRAYNQRLKPW
jgi:hypothetical protein